MKDERCCRNHQFHFSDQEFICTYVRARFSDSYVNSILSLPPSTETSGPPKGWVGVGVRVGVIESTYQVWGRVGLVSPTIVLCGSAHGEPRT